ncbi:hypothetical protein PPACK8108_LOCUS16581 [Phakopsora pachyrhizi]|uniref:Uncharacterized protein n=1 Tax=Phakopsora pachyrhizi TaxID=170000 RepID=A0AAV0BBN6_PHAPC|nr:hypothetical protein PPACK8108_LOCUS16581 [Phakopsora pachyrhizi]
MSIPQVLAMRVAKLSKLVKPPVIGILPFSPLPKFLWSILSSSNSYSSTTTPQQQKTTYPQPEATVSDQSTQSTAVQANQTSGLSDLNQLREQFIQLDREHQKLKTKLHLELDQQVSAAGSTNSAVLSISHNPQVSPNLPSSAQMPGSNSFINTTSQSQSSNSISQLNNSNNNPQSAPILIHHENSFHQAQRDSGYSNGNNLIGDS